MRAQAVLFDLDGTLLDTLADLGDSMNAALTSLGFPPHPLESYRYFVGDGVRVLALRALPQALRTDEETVSLCVKRMREEYGRRWNVKTRPYPGIPELLDALTERGVPMCVLSNKPHPAVLDVMGYYFGRWKFTAAFGEQPAFPKKPDPAAALEIARLAAVPPGAFLYVGDTDTDMQTATAARMRPVGALWGFRTEEELRRSGADVLLGSPPDLVRLL
jgi:phosphoglycolate phosphatase